MRAIYDAKAAGRPSYCEHVADAVFADAYEVEPAAADRLCPLALRSAARSEIDIERVKRVGGRLEVDYTQTATGDDVAHVYRDTLAFQTRRWVIVDQRYAQPQDDDFDDDDDVPVQDALTKRHLEDAAVDLEDCALDRGGYAGCATLQPQVDIERSGRDTYALRGDSASANVFKIVRHADGAFVRRCDARAQDDGGCPQGGRW